MLLTKENLAAAIPAHETVVAVAKVFGVSNQIIYHKIREWGLSLDELRERETGPTQEEIAERAAEVRRGWSPAEERRRIVGGSPRRWRPPQYEHGDLVSVSKRWSS